MTAVPTAVRGRSARVTRVLRATRVKLVSHRHGRTTDRARRGTSVSPPASRMRVATNTTSLMPGSYITTSTGSSVAVPLHKLQFDVFIRLIRHAYATHASAV